MRRETLWAGLGRKFHLLSGLQLRILGTRYFMDHPLRQSVEIHARGNVGQWRMDNKAAGCAKGGVVETHGAICGNSVR